MESLKQSLVNLHQSIQLREVEKEEFFGFSND